MFWGFSEPINYVEDYKTYINWNDESETEINILQYGAGDLRHIILTLSKLYKYKNVKINIYIIEGCLEILARNLLLLSIIFENSDDLSVRGKTYMFMDIYGNSLLRPASYNYMLSKSPFLIKLITDLDECKAVAPFYNFDMLKYKERDCLETIFNYWQSNKAENQFDIITNWNNRLRKTLGTRYDYRAGAFDWHLQMKLKDNGLQQICPQEYKQFRENGIAFTFPEFEYTKPNKTFATCIYKNGNNYRHRGYLGDMIIGPYIPFGIYAKDEKMLQSNHGINQFRATDITERNLYEIIYEIQEQQEYFHQTGDTHEYGSVYLQAGKLLPIATNENASELKQYNKPMVKVNGNFNLFFLPVDEVLKVFGNHEMEQKFNIIFIGNNYYKFINNNNKFSNLMAEKCLIYFETKTYIVTDRKDDETFCKEIRDYAKAINLNILTKLNINKKYAFIKYKK